MSLIWNKPAWPFKWGMLCALLCKDNKFMNACVIISCVSSFVVKWHDTAAMANFQFHAKQAHHSILIVRNKNPNGVVLFWCRCLKWWRCCFVRWGVGICMFMYVRSGHYCNALANLLTYMGVFDLVQTRAACSDGFSNHCVFVSITKGQGFYVKLFFIRAFPLE